MQIDTYATLAAGLTSLLEASFGRSTSTGTGAGAAGLGPAALLSMGQSTSTGSATFGYTHLAALAAQLQSPITQQVSSRQREAEQNIIKQATALRINERHDEARELLEDLLTKNPTSGLAVHALGASTSGARRPDITFLPY